MKKKMKKVGKGKDMKTTNGRAVVSSTGKMKKAVRGGKDKRVTR